MDELLAATHFYLRCECEIVVHSVDFLLKLLILFLRSEVEKLSNTDHVIDQKKFKIRRIDDKEKRKYLKWKGKLIEKQ